MMLSRLFVIGLLISIYGVLSQRTIVRSVSLGEDAFIVKRETNVLPKNNKEVERHDDVIELNIGGQKMTTLRSTLTAVPKSKLSLMFQKENAKKMLSLDKQGVAFFDYNPLYFSYLLDQLREIKRMSDQSIHNLQISAPYMSSHVNFTHMLIDLGLTPDYFLSPTEGTHLNLTIDSLAGWKECYRSTYNTPFDLSVLTSSCNGSRLLVGCRLATNKKRLTLAAIGEREDIFHPCLPKQCKVNGKFKKRNRTLTCSSRHQCITQAKRGVGWYHVPHQTWGFVRGSLSFAVNPCDVSNLDADYRLCWSTQENIQQGFGDRCGSAKNLQNSNKWERLIYYIK
ncbi:unnamed protein product [Adineta ricciae]|uniref:Potassium channel tetramerisation-type BTB domain-containing protein n=1 Tax=Adineta ricciae TaxID=249248 RepID=A0A815CRU4_ADIRI|nr:unnamed protein product [Adineta ricciae]CAF1287734.1 unnamed protein product [Adineta ricciae]